MGSEKGTDMSLFDFGDSDRYRCETQSQGWR